MPKSEYGAAWERQPKESAPAYEAFSIYRDMGAERSLQAVATRLSKSLPLMKRWSRAWSWGERVRQYEDSLQREAQAKAYQKAVNSLAEMQTRHIKTAVLMQKIAVQALDALDPATLTPQDIARLIKEGSKLESDVRNIDPAIETQKRNIETGAASGLADAIQDAWARRKGGGDH